jgi:uncharacterized phage protein gp47/JayE
MIDVGNPYSRPFASLVESLQDSLLLGVEQPATIDILYRSGTTAYAIKGAGPVSGLADQVTGFVAGKPAVFSFGQHYSYAVGQLIWQPVDASDPSLAASWFPDDNSRLTVGYFYRDLPSGITDFNAGSVAGTLVRSVARELKLLYEQMDQAYQRAFIDYAQGAALDNVVALLGISRNLALPAQGAVTFSLKKAPRTDVVIPVGTRVADARGRLFKVTQAGVIPAIVAESFSPATTVLQVAQPIASLVHAQLRGASGFLATVDSAAGKPYGNDGRTVTLAVAPTAASTVLLSYLAKSPKVTVKVLAMDTGPEGNLGSGSLTVMPTPPRGVDGGVSNELPLTGGEAAEADDPLRERAKHALERAGNATLNAIRFAVLNVDGVDSVEVRDFSVDPAVPLGEVWVRFATGTPEIAGVVVDTVDKTRAAGIKARVTQVSTVTLSGRLCVIPDVAGAGKDALARYQSAVVGALGKLGIGEAVSARKLASLVFQIAGLADVGEVQLAERRVGDAGATPVTTDPYIVGPDEQARPDAGAIQVTPLQALAVSAATLTGAGHTLACTVKLLDDAGAAVPLRSMHLALNASVRGKAAATPNQPLQQVAQTTGSVTFAGADGASASFDAITIPGLAGLDVATLEVLVQAAAYPGIKGGSTALAQG